MLCSLSREKQQVSGAPLIRSSDDGSNWWKCHAVLRVSLIVAIVDVRVPQGDYARTGAAARV